MRVQDIMTRSIRSVRPASSIVEAARAMSEFDVGALPVPDGSTLGGIQTDRDIAVRAVARSMELASPVRDIMTPQVATCLPQESVDYALELMSDEQVRRISVCTARASWTASSQWSTRPSATPTSARSAWRSRRFATRATSTVGLRYLSRPQGGRGVQGPEPSGGPAPQPSSEGLRQSGFEGMPNA